jgi:predicted dehydrogenase
MDLIVAITGLEIEAVCADLQTVFEERDCPLGGAQTFTSSGEGNAVGGPAETVGIDTEDFGSVLIRFRGGARGVLHVSQVTAGRKNCLRWEAAGSRQSLSWNSERPNELWVGFRDHPNQLLLRDPALMHARAAQASSYPAGHNEGFPDTFKQLFIDFYRSIDDESYRTQPSYPTFADGHREILLCEAILSSAREQRWVEV